VATIILSAACGAGNAIRVVRASDAADPGGAPHATFYVQVENPQETLNRAGAKGARVIGGCHCDTQRRRVRDA